MKAKYEALRKLAESKPITKPEVKVTIAEKRSKMEKGKKGKKVQVNR